MATIQKTLKSSGGDFSTVQEVCNFLYNNLSGTDSFDILCEPGTSFGTETDENSIAGEFLDFNGNTVTFRTDPSDLSNPAILNGHIYISGPGNSNSGLISFENLIMTVNPGLLYTSRSWHIQVLKNAYPNVSFKQTNCELIIYIDNSQCFPGYGGDGIIENCTLLFSKNSTQLDGFGVIYFSNGPCLGEVILRNSIILINSNSFLSGGELSFYIYGATTNYNNTFFNYKTLSPIITTLSANIDDIVTEIPLISVSGFRTDTSVSYGKVQIGSEIIGYNGISLTSLTGCSRGIDSTLAESHLSGATVTEITPDFNFLAGTFNNNEIGNPNLSGGTIIATDTDTIATLLGKNISLTSASVNCIDNTNGTYDHPIDIIGTLRPQGAGSDRGAYEFVSDLYFLSGAGNWDDGSHWSLTSAGPSANKIPDQTTSVKLTDYSGQCTITGTASCNFIYDGSSSQNKGIIIDGSLSIYGDGDGLLKNHIISGTGTINLYGSFTLEGLSCDNINVTSGSNIDGNIVGGNTLTMETNASDLLVANVTTVNGLGFIIGSWTTDLGGDSCEAYPLIASIYKEVGDCYLYAGAGIVESYLSDTNATLHLVSGTYNSIDWQLGNIANSGTINTLDIADFNPSIPIGLYSCSSISGRGIINNFILSACGFAATFDFNNMKLNTSMNINGNSNLTLSGNLTYSGQQSGSIISGCTIINSNASGGNPIYALGTDIINGGGNTNWVFPPPTTVYETIGISGRDYATIREWNSATSGLNLITENEIRIGLCYNDSPFIEDNILVLSGATTDIDHYRKLSVASGQGHSGNVNEGVNLDGRLIIKESYFQLDGLRIHGSNIYNTGTISVSGTIVTLSGGTFPSYFGKGDNIIIDISGTPETKMIWTRDSDNQLTIYTSATSKIDVAYEIYHYAATVIYCPGSSSSKNITIKNCIIHDWVCVDKNGWDPGDEPHGAVYGIDIIQNGGCKVFNNLIVNLLKINADSDYGTMAGIRIANSVGDNYVCNNTVLNIECTANFMKAAGGIGIYSDSNHTLVKNNISIVRHYVYDQSSIPNATIEDYSFDFTGGISGSGYNCERGGGYLQQNFMPGDLPNNSISGADPFSVFVFPDHSPNYGNGFYGFAWQAKGIDTFGNSTSYNEKFIDTQIYQVALGESGNISFENMYVFEWVGGYEYISLTSAGTLKLYQENGVSANDGIPTRTLSGTFSYNRNSSSFVLVSGSAELSAAIEMDTNGLIKFKDNYITTDWSSVPIQPSGGNYYKDAFYNLISASDSHPSGGLITSGIMCIGSIHNNNSFLYSISERVLNTTLNAHLKAGSPCISAGFNLSSEFSELNTDIAGVTRDSVWDIGAYKYIASSLRNLFREIYYYRNITIGS